MIWDSTSTTILLANYLTLGSTETAKLIGTTRNAVIGKWNRLHFNPTPKRYARRLGPLTRRLPHSGRTPIKAPQRPQETHPMLIGTDEAITFLGLRIKAFRSQRAYARYLGVQVPYISAMLNGKTNISGAVAKDLGLTKVTGYQLTVNRPDTEQVAYENSRAKWREHCANVGLTMDNTGVRSTVAPVADQRLRELEAAARALPGTPSDQSFDT